MTVTIHEVPAELRGTALGQRDKDNRFERLTAAYLPNDPEWATPFSEACVVADRSVGTLQAVAPTTDELRSSFDQEYGIPSAAAAGVFGRISNGRVERRVDGTKMTYAGWLDQQIAGTP